jgi:hypothetical protein
LEPPKTPNSRRNVVLAKRAVEALLRHRERQAAEGFPVDGDALVFTNWWSNKNRGNSDENIPDDRVNVS